MFASRLRTFLDTAPAFLPYALAVGLEKGFSLVTIPLMARRLPAAEIGALDVAVALVEFVGLLMTLGLAQTAIRFAGVETNAAARSRHTADIFGAGFVVAVTGAALLQVALEPLAKALGVTLGGMPLRVAVLGACATGLIELPLTWLRLNGKAWAYARYIGLRAFVQAAMVTGLLLSGSGAETLLLANGVLNLCFALVLVMAQTRDIGIGYSWPALQKIAVYGLPVVGGLLALFLLGNCDRWFLVAHVEPADIAYYGLAAKLSMITAIAYQPFLLWWSAYRLSLFVEKNPARYTEAWGRGVALLLAAALAVCVGAPVLIHEIFPPHFQRASSFVPFLVLISVLNELCSLTNTAVYARKHAFGVLALNGCGGVAALIGYALLIPQFGISGAIAATVTAQVVRVLAFVIVSQRLDPRPYPWARAGVAFVICFAAAGASPGGDAPFEAMGWLVVSLLAFGAAAVRLRLVQVPALRRTPVHA